MHEMLFCKSKPSLPSSQPNQQFVWHESGLEDSNEAEARQQVPSSRGNTVSLDTLETKRKKSGSDSDDESVGSAGTYTIELDGKEELRRERAQIDVAFGIVTDSTADNRTSTDSSGAYLVHADVDDDDDDEGDDECSLQIHEDSDKPDQPRLKRTKNQMLFPKKVENGASSSGVSYSGGPLDNESSANVDRNPDNAREPTVVSRDISVALNQETKTTKLTGSQSSMKCLPAEVNGVAVRDEADVAFTHEHVRCAATDAMMVVVAQRTTQNSKNTSIRDDEDDDDDFYGDDRPRSAAIQLLRATENLKVKLTNWLRQTTIHVQIRQSGISHFAPCAAVWCRHLTNSIK